MIICGIKITHDGALSLIDNGKLIFSYEMEKLNNKPRYQAFDLTLRDIESILNSYGYSLKKVDHIVIDGWGDELIPGKKSDEEYSRNIEIDEGVHVNVRFAPYGHYVKPSEELLESEDYYLKEIDMSYLSYSHVSGHIMSAYCSSPFAVEGEDSFVLVWDGGMPPQLFYYEPLKNKIHNLGALFYIIGYIYTYFPHKFKPFSLYPVNASIAGKVMAYIATGQVDKDVLTKYEKIYEELTQNIDETTLSAEGIADITHKFINKSKEYCDAMDIAHEDMLTTFHVFLQNQLLQNLERMVNKHSDFAKNLCFVGGCALNIKWNSQIRNSGLFTDVWVPPFPNDSGSAIGTACCAMVAKSDKRKLDWNVYTGPALKETVETNNGFEAIPCSLKDLAMTLHETDEPIVFLNGRAEQGPRALGNRSILAATSSPTMKEKLNEVKIRENYRPIAPICLEEDASQIFSPGTSDPYMLFDHKVRDNWINKVPAVVHLDGTSRLQTVNQKENEAIYELLTEYKAISGLPLLCNTSANYKGKGFFPDVKSVMEWGKVNYIWSEGILYAKVGAFIPFKLLKTEGQL